MLYCDGCSQPHWLRLVSLYVDINVRAPRFILKAVFKIHLFFALLQGFYQNPPVFHSAARSFVQNPPVFRSVARLHSELAFGPKMAASRWAFGMEYGLCVLLHHFDGWKPGTLDCPFRFKTLKRGIQKLIDFSFSGSQGVQCPDIQQSIFNWSCHYIKPTPSDVLPTSPPWCEFPIFLSYISKVFTLDAWSIFFSRPRVSADCMQCLHYKEACDGVSA